MGGSQGGSYYSIEAEKFFVGGKSFSRSQEIDLSGSKVFAVLQVAKSKQQASPFLQPSSQ